MYRKNVKLLSIFNFLIGFSPFAPLAIIYFSKVSGSFTLGASIFGIIMLVRWFMKYSGMQPMESSALNILKERYAKGEIDKKEFEEKKKELI